MACNNISHSNTLKTYTTINVFERLYRTGTAATNSRRTGIYESLEPVKASSASHKRRDSDSSYPQIEATSRRKISSNGASGQKYENGVKNRSRLGNRDTTIGVVQLTRPKLQPYSIQNEKSHSPNDDNTSPRPNSRTNTTWTSVDNNHVQVFGNHNNNVTIFPNVPCSYRTKDKFLDFSEHSVKRWVLSQQQLQQRYPQSPKPKAVQDYCLLSAPHDIDIPVPERSRNDRILDWLDKSTHWMAQSAGDSNIPGNKNDKVDRRHSPSSNSSHSQGLFKQNQVPHLTTNLRNSLIAAERFHKR